MFPVAGSNKFGRQSLAGCQKMPSLNETEFEQKGFSNLRLFNLTSTLPKLVEICIGQRLNQLRWLCLRNSVIQKLPSGIAYCSHLHVLDLEECKALETLPD